MLAADNLVACEQRRAVDAGGVRDAAMATRCPRPWACSAWRLGRLGQRLSRAPHAPPDFGSGIDKDRPDYTVVIGEWEVGRIYETRGGPDSLRWFWSMTVNSPMTRSDRVATLEEAKAQFQKRWDTWKAWAKMEELE